jgi:hypothetical protein
MSDGRKHWLVRPETVRKLWGGFAAVLVATVAVGLLVQGHPHFDIERLPGFYAWYGFLTCVAMVLVARLLGRFLKRRDTYYDD